MFAQLMTARVVLWILIIVLALLTRKKEWKKGTRILIVTLAIVVFIGTIIVEVSAYTNLSGDELTKWLFWSSR